MTLIRKRSIRLLTLCFVIIASSLIALAVFAKRPANVSILMPAPFADSTTELVNIFNQQHRGSIHLDVIRGPLETEAISDLAILVTPKSIMICIKKNLIKGAHKN